MEGKLFVALNSHVCVLWWLGSGSSWSRPVAMVGTGCARPRLLLVGETLLLSGGRLRYATADKVGPSTVRKQRDCKWCCVDLCRLIVAIV